MITASARARATRARAPAARAARVDSKPESWERAREQEREVCMSREPQIDMQHLLSEDCRRVSPYSALASIMVQDPDSEAMLKLALAPTVFALSSGTIFARPDRYHLACVRWSAESSGCRQVLLTPEALMLSWLKSQTPKAQLADVSAAFRDLTSDTFASYASFAKTGVYCTTVAAGDSLYVPPAFILCERAQGKVSVGVQMRLVTSHCRVPLQAVLAELGQKIAAKHVLRAAVAATKHVVSERPVNEGALAVAAAATGQAQEENAQANPSGQAQQQQAAATDGQ